MLSSHLIKSDCRIMILELARQRQASLPGAKVIEPPLADLLGNA
jgi:hypothetical protein